VSLSFIPCSFGDLKRVCAAAISSGTSRASWTYHLQAGDSPQTPVCFTSAVCFLDHGFQFCIFFYYAAATMMPICFPMIWICIQVN
jgi:hypothetical protein